MSKVSRTPDPAFVALLGEVLKLATERGMTAKVLAARADISPETLSRMKARGYGDLSIISKMARMVGYRIALVPDDDTLSAIQKGDFF